VGGTGWLWGKLEAAPGDQLRWAVVAGPHAVPDADPPAWEITLAPLQTGELEPPVLSVTVRPPEGEPVTAAPTKVPKIEVVSVLPPDGPVKPAPLADPVGVHGFPWEWVLPATAVVVPATLLAWWLWRRRRRRREGLDEKARALPPLEELSTLLERLRSGVGRLPAGQLCDGLAAGVRRFLERRTGAAALEMTSFEVRRMARRAAWPEDVQRGLGAVLSVADSVRFARRPAGESELVTAFERALEAAEGLEASIVAGELAESEALEEASA